MSSSPPIVVAGNDPTRFSWWPLLAAAVAAVVLFAWAVSQRLGYPHELEWMEGALADHAWRVAQGLPLYCEPGPEHVPFLYAPLLFWLGGLGITLGLDGITALRLVAITCSIGTALLIGHWVRVATGRVVPGLCASGLFVAGYGWLAFWYDLARNDSLFVFFVLATACQLVHGGARRWLWAALLATTALLAKQSALMWLPAIGVGALCHEWRTASRFAIASALVMSATFGILHVASDGWSTFYLFEMPRQHGWVGDRMLGYWTEDLRPMLPLLLLGCCGFVEQWRAGARRDALFLAAFGCGGLATSWLSRMHVGGFDNVMMYGFAGACVLGPIAAVARARWLRVAAPLLLLAQFAWLAHAAWARHPTLTMLPSAAHRRAHEELVAFVTAQPGPVWIPAHGYISTRAGKGTGAHGQAIFDLLQGMPKLPDGTFDLEALNQRDRLAAMAPRNRRALLAFIDRGLARIRDRYFAAIVVDERGTGILPQLFGAAFVGADGRLDTADDPYVRLPGPLLSEPTALRPLLGYEVHSPYGVVPKPK